MQRRQWLAATAACWGLDAAFAQAARTGFNTEGLAATLQALGLQAPQPSRDLQLDAPDIAENGAQVSVTLSCKLPTVKKFWLLAERNPNALIAVLEWSDLLEPRWTTQVKLAQSGLVYGVAQLADNKLLLAQKDVKVTLGGCGA